MSDRELIKRLLNYMIVHNDGSDEHEELVLACLRRLELPQRLNELDNFVDWLEVSVIQVDWGMAIAKPEIIKSLRELIKRNG